MSGESSGHIKEGIEASSMVCQDVYCAGFWNQGNIHNIELSIGLLVFISIESRAHILLKLRPPIAPRQIVRIGISHLVDEGKLLGWQLGYFVFSVFFSMGFAVVDFWLTKFDRNLVLLRALNIGELEAAKGIGHWLVWLTLLLVFLRYGWADVVHGAFTVGLLVAIHEAMWYVAYSLIYTTQAMATIYYYSPFFLLFGSLALGYFRLSNAIPRDRILRTLVIGVAFFVVWSLAGLPVSVNNITGPTELYYDLVTNAVEDISWLVMGVSLIA